MLISDGGTVIKMSADDIKRSGRATQGVIVMRLREGEQVSTLAPVIGSDDDEPEDEVTTDIVAVTGNGVVAEDLAVEAEPDEPEEDGEQDEDEDEL